MFVGFDYGTSNCALAYINNGKPRLIPLYEQQCFVPSTVYALERPLIADAIWQQMPAGTDKINLAAAAPHP